MGSSNGTILINVAPYIPRSASFTKVRRTRANSDLGSFLERARSLGDHLGPTLMQFPPSFSRNSTTIGTPQPASHADSTWTTYHGLSFSSGALEAFISRWPQPLPCAIEFRHASWYCQETYQVRDLQLDRAYLRMML